MTAATIRNGAGALRFRLAVCTVLVSLTGCSTVDLEKFSAAYHRRAIESGAIAPRVDFQDPVLHQRKIIVTTMINQLTAHEVISKLLYLEQKSHEPIDLYLKTDGGYHSDAFAVVDVIKSLKSPVNTWAVAGCHSAGALLLAAGTGRRYAYPNTLIVVHGAKPLGKIPPEFDGLVRGLHNSFWKQHARLPAAWFPLTSGKDHVLTPELALEYGVVDEIAHPKK